MNDKQYGAWLMELASYFITKEHYQMITLSRANDEIWLVNPSNKHVPLLLITTRTTQDFNDDALQKQRETLAVIFQTSPRGLNISVNDKSTRFDEINAAVGPDFKSPTEGLDFFENIETVLKPSKNLDYSYTKALVTLKRTIAKSQGFKSKPLYATIAISVMLVVFNTLTYFFLQNIMSYEMAYLALGAFYKPLVVEGFEMWRFVTSAFLTTDIFELILAIMIMRSAGKLIEPTTGPMKFLGLFLAGIIFGNIMLFITMDVPLGAGIVTGICSLLGYIMVIVFEIKAFRNSRIMSQLTSLTIITLLYISLPTVTNYGMLGATFLGVLFGFLDTKRTDWQKIRDVLKVAIPVFITLMVAICFMHLSFESDVSVQDALIRVYDYFNLDWYVKRLQAMKL